MTAETKKPRLFIPYEVPLGDGESARLVLPADLTGDEAERLCGTIRALAFTSVNPPAPAGAAGEETGGASA